MIRGPAVTTIRVAAAALMFPVLAHGGALGSDSGAPWLEIQARPSEALVYASEGGTDAVVNLELMNRRDHRVRIEKVSMLFMSGERVLRSEPMDSEFFRDKRRVERGRRIEWRAICIESPPEEADRVRFEVELSGRKRRTTRQSVDVPLEKAAEPSLLSLPFEGLWRVDQGHTCTTMHRQVSPGGEFAWDFTALGHRSVSESYGKTHLNKDASSFGKVILAPADGRVARVLDGVPDNDGLKKYPRRSLLASHSHPEWIFGNFVVLELRDGRFVLLGHLKQYSITVKEGDTVRRGKAIARCGNSGNTFRPHLHLQVMNRMDPAHPEVKGLPGAFVDYTRFTVVGEGEQRELNREPVSEGDPPEGSIVAPGPETEVPRRR